MVGTVMERSRTPLSTWFCAAYLVASQTKGMSAVQFQRQLGLTRYETAFGIVHELRAGMVRPDRDRIGAGEGEYVEVDESYVGGRTRGEGRGVHHKTLVAAAVEVRYRKPGTAQDKRKDGRYAERVRLAVADDRSADSLCGFVESTVMPGSRVVTDDWSAYGSLRARGFDHHAIAERGDPEVVEEFLPIVRYCVSLTFAHDHTLRTSHSSRSGRMASKSMTAPQDARPTEHPRGRRKGGVPMSVSRQSGGKPGLAALATGKGHRM